MPQVIVDTATESPQSLVMLSRLFQDYAMLKAKELAAAGQEYETIDRTAIPTMLAAAPLKAIPQAGETMHTAVERTMQEKFGDAYIPIADPAVLFAKKTPAISAEAFHTPAPPVVDLLNPTERAVVPPGTELDSAQVPWDARIHSSAKGVKKDGTWKLARNVDKALVTMVLQEITPRPHVVDGVVIPVGAVLPAAQPVTVPVPVPVPAVGASPVPDSGVPAAVSPAVPVPPVPAAGGVPAAPLNPVRQFQAFMKLVAEGQAAAPPKFTHADVVAACIAEGVAQLQLVIMAPDKIPAIKARLGLV